MMKNNKILVIGSSNTDMVVKTPKLPLPGETILGGDFLMNPGGKGANQAIAAHRLGASVYMVGRVGNDPAADEALHTLRSEGIDLSFCKPLDGFAPGLAMIVAVPFSLGAAVYIGEFATGKTREFLKITVELLAAIPSVVWGFIGLSIMNPLIIDLFNVPVGLNVLNAGIILGLMAAPIMTTIAEDALKAVPDGYREAAEAQGRGDDPPVLRGSDHGRL